MASSTSARTILITAASGNIGSELVPLITTSSPTATLILPTRSATKLRSSVPASTSSQVKVEEGDIMDPTWFQSLLTQHAVDTVFLCLHVAYGSELDATLNLLDAMRRAGTVKQLVYVGICGDFVSAVGIEKLSRLCDAGHMIVKIPIELKLKHGGFEWATTVLGPSLFFTNDTRSKRAMLEDGVFDEPLERVSRVSPKDIALAARNVMFAPKGKYDGKKIQLGSLKQFSGAEIAELWSKALGKEVRPFGGDSQASREGPEALEKFNAEHLKTWGAVFVRDVWLMYENFKAMGFGMSEEEYAVQVEVLGKEAEDYGAWVTEMGKKWKEEVV